MTTVRTEETASGDLALTELGASAACRDSVRSLKLVLSCKNRRHSLCGGRPFGFAQGDKPHKCHGDIAPTASGVILSAAKNLDCYACLCHRALVKREGVGSHLVQIRFLEQSPDFLFSHTYVFMQMIGEDVKKYLKGSLGTNTAMITAVDRHHSPYQASLAYYTLLFISRIPLFCHSSSPMI